MNKNDRKFLETIVKALKDASKRGNWNTVTNITASIEWALKTVPKT